MRLYGSDGDHYSPFRVSTYVFLIASIFAWPLDKLMDSNSHIRKLMRNVLVIPWFFIMAYLGLHATAWVSEGTVIEGQFAILLFVWIFMGSAISAGIMAGILGSLFVSDFLLKKVGYALDFVEFKCFGTYDADVRACEEKESQCFKDEFRRKVEMDVAAARRKRGEADS